jgi:outer membrane receptor for ferrienterochelin and colicin
VWIGLLSPVLAQTSPGSSKAFLTDISKLNTTDTSATNSQFQVFDSDFHELDIRETSGSVTIITAEQIQNMGANDLMEVLAFLPTTYLGRDIDDAIGVGMRGLWAHEGKLCVMLNGIPLNELDYGTFVVGGRLSIDNISRIEVVTGPGALNYGGTAALGVFNIITKSPLETTGSRVTATVSQSNGFINNQNVSVNTYQRLTKQTMITFNASVKTFLRSTWTDPYIDGKPLSYGDSTKGRDQTFHVSLSRKYFRTQLFLNDYNYEVSDTSYTVVMKMLAWDNEWKYHVNQKLSGQVRALYQFQLPWNTINTTSPEYLAENTLQDKVALSFSNTYKFNDKWSAEGGIQGYHQIGMILDRQITWNYNNQRELRVSDISGFAELKYRSRIGIFNAGSRVEKNTFTNTQFAPRVAWNVILGNWYLKALSCQAFRVPTAQNVNLGPVESPLKAERVTTNEFTVGFQLKKTSSLQVTFFQTNIKNPVVFVVDPASYDSYKNRDRCGTYGIEMRYNVGAKRLQVNGALSYYHKTKSSDVPEMIAEGKATGEFLGMPLVKGTLTTRYKLSPSLNWCFAIMGQGSQFSYETMPSGEIELVSHSSSVLVNSGFIYNPTKLNGLTANFGVSNIFNQKFVASSPFNNDVSSIPLLARQVTLKISYLLK